MTEHYLLYNKKHISAIAKFRAGHAPLRMEMGCHGNIDEADRVPFHSVDNN